MKKSILLLVIILQAVCAYPNVSNGEIKLPENHKVKGSFSGELFGEESFHVVVAQEKDKRDYELFLYTFSNDEMRFLNKVTYEKQPSILSFHSTDNILTLVVSYDNSRKPYYDVLDLDIISGEITKSSALLNEDSLATFRAKNETILVNGTKKLLTATRIMNSSDISKISVNDSYSKDIYLKYFNGSLDEINQEEFVRNGSTISTKGYYFDDSLFFTKDVTEFVGADKKLFTSSLTFDLNTGSLSEQVFDKSAVGKIKKKSSYVLDDLFVQMATNKKEGFVYIYKKGSNELLNTLDFLKLDFSDVITGEDFTTIEDFLKESNKGKFVSTITLNRTRTNNYLLRVDYVENTYNYNYNWWWWHRQMFMMHNQQMMMQQNIPRGFGPHDFSGYHRYLSFEDTSDFSFQFVIDANGKILKGATSITGYKQIDKKKYVDELNDDKTLKHTSSCFLDGAFRYIGYNKNNNSFSVFNKSIK